MSDVPLHAIKLIDEICVRFEDAWKNARSLGQRSRVEDYLTSGRPGQLHLVRPEPGCTTQIRLAMPLMVNAAH
jgi:hypothetical protein